MKKASSVNSIIALVFLFVAILTVGVMLRDGNFIEASSNTLSTDQNPNFVALKNGENQFVAAQAISLDSELIGINGSLITLREAERRGIIQSVYLFEASKILGQDVTEIQSDQQFVILVNDISSLPTIYLRSVK